MPAPDPPFPAPASRNVLEPGCTRCPHLVADRERIAWGNGSRDAEVMVVGEAPGLGDPDADRWRGGNWTGRSYTNRHSGRLVRSMFAELGYGPDELYVTNAVKCLPLDDDGETRSPTDDELETCFTHLGAELDRVDPTVVVPTGKHPTRILLDRTGRELDGFVEHVLEPIECPGLGVTLLPVLHPAYQHVWVSRLGYDREGYVETLGERLAACLPG